MQCSLKIKNQLTSPALATFEEIMNESIVQSCEDFFHSVEIPVGFVVRMLT